MRLIRTDIDELLEATNELVEEDFKMSTIEIDHLLEMTQDW
ncbi:hypothetical protein ACFYKX_06010 [Cytobacillus sp. FJAT-54145]|uniref:Uncharacterized protein n=1 Tax=Cytobacillus spartinae TaxID=3299023 RepID=A0ABW6KB56_9BACI